MNARGAATWASRILVTPDDPVERWGVEGLLTAIDRGSLRDWRRIDAARAEVQRRLSNLVEDSGLTAAQFAQRLGTSASRMSTYLTGKVVPSAALLVRAENVAKASPSRR